MKLDKSTLSTKMGMVQDILERNTQLMKDIEEYQREIDKETSAGNSGLKMEVDGTGAGVADVSETGGEKKSDVVSNYVDSVQELNCNLSQVKSKHLGNSLFISTFSLAFLSAFLMHLHLHLLQPDSC